MEGIDLGICVWPGPEIPLSAPPTCCEVLPQSHHMNHGGRLQPESFQCRTVRVSRQSELTLPTHHDLEERAVPHLRTSATQLDPVSAHTVFRRRVGEHDVAAGTRRARSCGIEVATAGGPGGWVDTECGSDASDAAREDVERRSCESGPTNAVPTDVG